MHCANSIWYVTPFADKNHMDNTTGTARQKPRYLNRTEFSLTVSDLSSFLILF